MKLDFYTGARNWLLLACALVAAVTAALADLPPGLPDAVVSFVASAKPWLAFVSLILAGVAGNWETATSREVRVGPASGSASSNALRAVWLSLLPAAALVSGCGGGQVIAMLPPAADSLNVSTDGAADVDITMGDVPLMRLKTDGAAEAGYDLRTGPYARAEGCAQLYLGPFRQLVVDTCAEVLAAPEGSGDD